MSSLFPFINVDDEIEISLNKELPALKEVAIDFKTGSPVLENKTFKVVEGKDALKVWIYRSLKIDRFHYLIYSWDYGNELMDLMGKGYTEAHTQAELKRYIEDALLINPYIKSIELLDSSFSDNTLQATLKVDSIYGEMEVVI